MPKANLDELADRVGAVCNALFEAEVFDPLDEFRIHEDDHPRGWLGNHGVDCAAITTDGKCAWCALGVSGV